MRKQNRTALVTLAAFPLVTALLWAVSIAIVAIITAVSKIFKQARN